MRFLNSVLISGIILLHLSVFTPIVLGAEKLVWTESLDMLEQPGFQGWKLVETAEPDFMPRIYNGVFTLDTTSQECVWFYEKNLDFSNREGYTIEARIRINDITTSDSSEGIAIGFDDGVYEERLYFTDGSVGLYHINRIHRMNTVDDFHVYRVTIKGNKIKLYADGKLVTEGSLNAFDSGMNRIYFGDGENAAGNNGKAHWDYIRVYTEGAISEDILYPADYIKYINSQEE